MRSPPGRAFSGKLRPKNHPRLPTAAGRFVRGSDSRRFSAHWRGRSAVLWPCAGATAQDGAGETTPFWRARGCRARAGLPFWRSSARRRGVIRACIPKKALWCSWLMKPTVPFRMQPCKRPRRGTRALGGGRQRSSLGVWVPGNAAPVRPAAVGARVVFERPERCCSWADRAGRRSSTDGRRALSARRPWPGLSGLGFQRRGGREVARTRGVSSQSCRRRRPAQVRRWQATRSGGGSLSRCAFSLSPVGLVVRDECVWGT